MVNLHIEHTVFDFASWKQAFDSDPVGRRKHAVRSYRIMRAVDDPNRVTIDLVFDTAEQAQALLAAIREVWGRITGSVIMEPRAQIADIVEIRND